MEMVLGFDVRVIRGNGERGGSLWIGCGHRVKGHGLFAIEESIAWDEG